MANAGDRDFSLVQPKRYLPLATGGRPTVATALPLLHRGHGWRQSHCNCRVVTKIEESGVNGECVPA